jgi:hypothetical protein
MSPVLRRWSIVALSVVLSALPATLVRAQDDDIEHVVPDAYYVTAECSRLLATAPADFERARAQSAVRAACTAYAASHDGDAWFAAIKDARTQLDSFQSDHTQHGYKIVRPQQLVPENGRVYVIFLAPASTAWASADLSELRETFEDFGNAIGAGNLAIWFEAPADPSKIDTARCRYYFDLFKLAARNKDPQRGPYIITTSTRPDHWSTANDAVVVDLGGESLPAVSATLARLGSQLQTPSGAKASDLAGIAGRYQAAAGAGGSRTASVSVTLLRGT